MKKLTTILLTLLATMALSSASFATELPCGDSCLDNRGFENGNLSSWSYNSSHNIAVYQSSSSGHYSNSGSFLAKLHRASSWLGQSKPAVAGESFTLTGYVRRGRYSDESGLPNTYVRLAFKDASGTIISEQTVQVTAGGSYEAYTVSGTAPAGTATVKAWVSKPYNTGWITVDDFCLQKTSGPTAPVCDDQCLANADFEDGNLNDWWTIGNVTAQTAGGHFPNSGSWLAKIHENANGMGQAKPAVAGDEFNLCVFARSASSSDVLILKFLDANNQQISAQSTPLNGGSSSYQKYCVSGTAPAGTAKAEAIVWKNSGDGWVTVDDFCMEKTASGPTTDFGDAPASYQDASNIVDPNFTLGATIDGESSQANSNDANGDGSDEDGVIFGNGGMGMGETCSTSNTVKLTVNNTVRNDVYLKGWIDFNGNGTFDTAEQIVDIKNIGNGANQMFTVTYEIPCNAAVGTTYARFRLDDQDDDGATGASPYIGEVEDYLFAVKSGAMDLGDLPDSYQTLVASNGARHTIVDQCHLGGVVDAETDGQPSVTASGDGSDEDGVNAIFFADGSASFAAIATTTGCASAPKLYCFVDWNVDGDFADAGEAPIAGVTMSNGSMYTTALAGPAIAPGSMLNYRCRLSTDDAAAASFGLASDGEIEDYQNMVEASLPVELVDFTAAMEGDLVELKWMTATETNNAGFAIEQLKGADFEEIAFVAGAGSTTEASNYSFTVANTTIGKLSFRLKQVDFDGTSSYSDVVEIDVELAGQFKLDEVYPNPFNPMATVQFAVKESQPVKVMLFNTMGQHVKTLFEGTAQAGSTQQVRLDGSDLSSGTYLVQLVGHGIKATQTVTLMK